MGLAHIKHVRQPHSAPSIDGFASIPLQQAQLKSGFSKTAS